MLIYHVDRLTRRPIELEQFLDVLTVAKVRHVRFVAGGDLDVGNGDGLMVLRMLLAVAANESSIKSRRVKRKMQQNAEAGLPHGGCRRPFGYDEDKVTVRADEAQIIRALADRFLAGESLRSLALWLDEQDVSTVGGKPWRTPPYLLSGLLRCGRCRHRLYSAPREDVRRYVCSSGPDHGGCGGTFVLAAPVEDLIARAVLQRLDTPGLADALAGRAAADEPRPGCPRRSPTTMSS